MRRRPRKRDLNPDENHVTKFGGREWLRVSMLNRINSLVARDPEASRRRFGQAMARLNKAWNLAKSSDTARALRDDIKLYQALYGYINQKAPEEQKDPEILDSAIQQILDDTIRPEGLADILEIGNEKSIFDIGGNATTTQMSEKIAEIFTDF